MEKRSRRRIRDLVAHPASQGLDANENRCARISMMARSANAPLKGRIQKRKTNNLQIITSGLQRTAGPYRCANRRHSQCSRLSYSSPRRGAPSAAKSVLIRSPGRRTQAGWATEIERLSATHTRRCAASELSVIAKRAPPKCTRRSPTKVVERPRPSKGATNLQSRISVHRPLSGAKTERGG